MSGRELLPLVMLAMETRELVLELGDWHVVGGLAETLLGSAAGTDSISSLEVRQFRGMARRWSAMPSDLRMFYAGVVVESEVASIALYGVLVGDPGRLSDRICGAVYSLYRETYGVDSPWTLFPRIYGDTREERCSS